MNRNNLIPNTLIIIAVIGIVLAMYGKTHPEFGASAWEYVEPFSIWLATVFCIIAILISFPRKLLIDKGVNPILYLKPVFWFALLVFYWLRELGVIYT